MCVEGKMGGSIIILNDKFRSVHFQDLGFKIGEIFEQFLIAMQMHYLTFGSYSLAFSHNCSKDKSLSNF